MNLKQHIAKNGGFEKLKPYQKEVAPELLAFEEKYRGKSVIATEYQLGRGSNGFSVKMKELRRNNCLVECEFFVKINLDSITNGRLFVLDEEATEKRLKDSEDFKAKVQETQELESAVGEEVAEAIKAIGKSAKVKVSKK